MIRRWYRRCLRTARRALEALGFNFARTSDYYSPLPVLSELAKSRERWDRASAMVGVEYDLEAMQALLAGLAERWTGEYRELPDYREIKALGYGPGFTTVDAMTLYWMIRDLAPKRYFEVGSGLSTYYAWLAASRNAAEGSPCAMRCIDPYATAKVRTIPGLEVLARPVQEVDPEIFRELGPGDVLFIDSTHVVKLDGDVPFLYLEAVPRLRGGVVVHAHDIHFPYNVPHPAKEYLFDAKWPSFWTEAMLLQAFLSFNPTYEILLSTPLLRFHCEDFLAATLPGYRPVASGDYDTHYGSIWLRKVASSTE
jgi:Methyltransferase domain